VIDRIDLFALVVLAQCVATITLSAALVVLYWHSRKLRHVLPLALAYNLIAALAAFRLYQRLVTDLYVQWVVLIAFTIGNVGLLIVLSDKWKNRDRGDVE
jgi:hypothetical protein